MLSIVNANLVFNEDTNIEKQLFENLNIHFNKGEFVTIIGDNGAGKSSLLNLISGSCAIKSGEIILNGNDILKESEWKRAKYIGRVFQSPAVGLAPDLTLLENFTVMLHKNKKYMLGRGLSKSDKEIIFKELKSLNVNLENKLSSRPNELSGGQCQSAALIMAVLANPLLLLLDEHTAALDPQFAKSVIKLTEQIITERSLTALMVTHNISDALRYGNRMIMIKNGNIHLDISCEKK